MPKMKSNRGAKKRFRKRGSGSIKRGQQHRTHILTKMSAKRKRNLRKNTTIDETQKKTVERLIQD